VSDIETPSAVYLAGRREWNERYGSYIARARQWRWMAIGLLGTTCISTCCAVWMASQAHVVPYVVEVDKLGERIAVGPVPPAPPVPIGTIKAQLARWIIDTRTVYADPIAGQNIITEAFAFVDAQSDAVEQLDAFMQANDPRTRRAKEAVGVAIESVGQIGADTWSVDWSEESRTKDGTGQLMTYWRASIRIKISPPADEKTIIVNPAGIYIEWFKVTPRTR
jgi:type IV secretion system protein VirB5